MRNVASRYGIAALCIALAIGVRSTLQPWLGDQLPFITCFAAVAAATWYGGRGPGILTAIVLYAAAIALFLKPFGQLIVSASLLSGLFLYALSCAAIILIGYRMRLLYARTADALEDLARLYELSSHLEHLKTLQDKLGAILTCATHVHGANLGLISIYDATREGLVVCASVGFPPQALAALGCVQPGVGACGLAFSERRRVVIQDTDTDPRFSPFRGLAHQAGFRSVHSVPLIAESGEVMGSLSVHLFIPRGPTEREMNQMDLLARKAALHIDRSRTDEARQRSEAQLNEANRRKDEFLATLAHELRNPLAPIRNAIRYLQLKDTGDADVANAREIIDRQVRHMVRLVDDLLDISRVTLGQIHLQNEVVSLGIIVANAIEASRPFVEASEHRLSVSLPPSSIYVEGDVTRLTQVLQNLLHNAAKYTPRGGHIALSAHRDGENACISVTDNGIGIQPNLLEKVFEMFAQVEHSTLASQAGLGIGLSLARRIVEMHNGSIEAKSAGEGCGSVFIVKLPICDRLVPGDHDSLDERNINEMPCRRILVVDDNEDGARSLGAVLELNGHQVQVAFDGNSALSKADAFFPEIVFLDIGMPKMDGYEVCRRLRAKPWTRGAKIVALTGWGQEVDRKRTEDAGFDHHLVKPADLRVIEKIVAETPSLSSTV